MHVFAKISRHPLLAILITILISFMMVQVYVFLFKFTEYENMKVDKVERLDGVWGYQFALLPDRDGKKRPSDFEAYLLKHDIVYTKSNYLLAELDLNDSYQVVSLQHNSELSKLSISDGRNFKNDDFKKAENFAAILDETLMDKTVLGQKMSAVLTTQNGSKKNISIKIVGYIEKNSAFPTMNSSGMVSINNIYVAMPDRDIPLNDTSFTVQVNKRAQKLLSQYEEKLFGSDYDLSKTNKALDVSFSNESMQDAIYFELVQALIFVAFTFLVVIQFFYRKLDLERKENGIHLLCGASKGDIIRRLGYELLSYFGTALAISMAYIMISKTTFKVVIEPIIVNFSTCHMLQFMTFNVVLITVIMLLIARKVIREHAINLITKG
ncbi:hypothetical protein PWEIH_08491 [Listeria weihenstephanensis FSL R9-0317]|uniref:ABC3 transporter permease protein domain-containing protein n=1 Tax=Listeria weihenstephanensis TaxID=1006155 RepID=A0A1S7FQE0_9LIST|nr:FtsX-like permease family protein [Listeria weihenstephanensis]AQY49614.1 hypothetical protein UE46_00055 [Listeria weihenstephanensis]EUJ39057.1 hypothetical protein PWEIH_08491 [Listeria weihenstephanensis FSL R9-0317]